MSAAPATTSFETIRFPVTGMVCGTCVNRITRSLRRLDGVAGVGVDLGRETVTVRRDPSAVSDAALAGAIAAVGYEADLDAAVAAPDVDVRSPLARLFGR